MDLMGLTSAAVGAINPPTPLAVKVSTGSTISADGTPTPTYATPVTVYGQVQPLSYADLRQLEGLNIQGSTNAVYFEGEIDAIIRSKDKGGDLITDPAGNVYLVTQVLELWADWCKVAVTLQNGS